MSITEYKKSLKMVKNDYSEHILIIRLLSKKRLYTGLLYFRILSTLRLKSMTYIAAFIVSMLILALIIVWSLIEIKQDLRKDKEMKSEF